MISRLPTGESVAPVHRTLWGLTPQELHDRFWASRGIQVVRPGSTTQIVADAELYLLIPSPCLALFRLSRLVDILSWVKPQVLFASIENVRGPSQGERAVTNGRLEFHRFERIYGPQERTPLRVVLTPRPDIAHRWAQARNSWAAWRSLAQEVPRELRINEPRAGRVYNAGLDRDLVEFTVDLSEYWRRPDATVRRVRKALPDVWVDSNASLNGQARIVGPVWVGSGRTLPPKSSFVGPAVLWDEPSARPPKDVLYWEGIEPTPASDPRSKTVRSRPQGYFGKRALDIVLALAAIGGSVFVYPFIVWKILREDGWPFHFVHYRESYGGRRFPCLKFRTMRNDAEDIKAELLEQNEVDGPQFFIENDPRLLRVGKFLRKTNLDEFLQFFNVLFGHMSVVGPRPSPHSENQYCPEWREARLSVRPGVTGLWQIKRTRKEGLDFQEWIQYDIEYVENMSLRLDLWILWKTFLKVVTDLRRSCVRRKSEGAAL